MRTFWIYILLFCFKLVVGQTNDLYLNKINQAKQFCNNNKMNTEFCFLVDFSKHSGKNRFYVYSFKEKRILYSGLVCHGIGKNSTPQKPIYSNEIGSNCSSLGKYKIGKRAYSNWGINIHYKMHGLEKTNSNAFKRNVVLHSYDYVSETEIYPSHLTMVGV